jgi:hypothetical protein
MFSEPSLALFGTHAYTFHIRPPSYANILPLDRGSDTRDGNFFGASEAKKRGPENWLEVEGLRPRRS